MSCNHIYAHFVFVTKKRQSVINPDRERELFMYIMGITTKLNGTLIRINAALNHIHILVKLPATISFSDYVATVKRSTSIYIKQNGLFPKFWGWAREYSVDTVSPHFVDVVKQYIANQKEHHEVKSFEDEWLEFLSSYEKDNWDMRYFDK